MGVSLLLDGCLGAAALGVQDCVTAALAHSPALASLRAGVQAAASADAKERDGLWPSLALSDQGDYSTYVPAAGFTDGMNNLANAELSLDLQRWLSSPQSLSRVELERSRLRLAQAQAQLRQEVTLAYDRAMLLRLKAQEGSQAADYVDSHLKDIQRLHALGVDVELDLLRAGSQRRTLELAANAQAAELQDTLAALRSLTGLDLHADDFQPDPAWMASVVQAPADPAAALDQRLLGTLRGQLAGLDLEAARLATRGTGPIAAPTLKVGVFHSVLAIDPGVPLDQTYASLSINAFDWGQRAAEGRQRAQELAAQQGDTREQLRRLSLDAEQLGIDIAAARRAYALSMDLLGDAQKALGIAKGYYRQGKLKETDLLSVFSDFMAALDQRDAALQAVLDKQSQWDALWEGGRP